MLGDSLTSLSLLIISSAASCSKCALLLQLTLPLLHLHSSTLMSYVMICTVMAQEPPSRQPAACMSSQDMTEPPNPSATSLFGLLHHQIVDGMCAWPTAPACPIPRVSAYLIRVSTACARRGSGAGRDDEGLTAQCRAIPMPWWAGGLAASSVACTAVLAPMLGLRWYEPLAAVALALLVAVLAVRALGQTDLNPVSGVGKLSQARPLFFSIPFFFLFF